MKGAVWADGKTVEGYKFGSGGHGSFGAIWSGVVIEVDRKRTWKEIGSVDLESKGPADYVESIISTWSDCG